MSVFKFTEMIRPQVALHESAVRVKMELVNKVTDVLLVPATLPPTGQQVPAAAKLQVELETQDGRGVPWEAAQEGLTLRLTPPGAPRALMDPATSFASGGCQHCCFGSLKARRWHSTGCDV